MQDEIPENPEELGLKRCVRNAGHVREEGPEDGDAHERGKDHRGRVGHLTYDRVVHGPEVVVVPGQLGQHRPKAACLLPNFDHVYEEQGKALLVPRGGLGQGRALRDGLAQVAREFPHVAAAAALLHGPERAAEGDAAFVERGEAVTQRGHLLGG